jgi:hypothetical protein
VYGLSNSGNPSPIKFGPKNEDGSALLVMRRVKFYKDGFKYILLMESHQGATVEAAFETMIKLMCKWEQTVVMA